MAKPIIKIIKKRKIIAVPYNMIALWKRENTTFLKNGKRRKFNILADTIKHASNMLHESHIFNSTGGDFHCSLSIKTTAATRPGFGFLIIDQQILVNLNYVDEATPFSFKGIMLIGNVFLKITRERQKPLEDFFKLHGLKCWKDMIKFT